jgi:hypothetical protein
VSDTARHFTAAFRQKMRPARQVEARGRGSVGGTDDRFRTPYAWPEDNAWSRIGAKRASEAVRSGRAWPCEAGESGRAKRASLAARATSGLRVDHESARG